MERNDENFADMADVTLGVLEANKGTWIDTPPAVAAVNSAKAAREAIRGAVQGQQARTTGFTEDKERLSDEAIRRGVKLARLVQAYALDEEDNALFWQMQLNDAALDRTADVELIEILYDLHRRISALGTAVRPYGVTAAMLTAFQEAIGAFRDANTTPRTVIVERMTHTAGIPVQLRAMRLAFKKLDRLVLIFEEEAPEFVSAYRNARVIIDRRGPGRDEVPDDGKKDGAPDAGTQK